MDTLRMITGEAQADALKEEIENAKKDILSADSNCSKYGVAYNTAAFGLHMKYDNDIIQQAAIELIKEGKCSNKGFIKYIAM